MITELIDKLMTIKLSAGEMFLGIILFLGGIALIIGLYSFCKKQLDSKDKKGYLAIKSLLIALSPVLLEILAIFEVSIPDAVYDILLGAAIILVLLWNIFSMGLFYGIIYTILSIALGFFISVSFIIALVVLVFCLFFGRDEPKIVPGNAPPDNSKTANDEYYPKKERVPDSLTKLSDGEVVYVTTGVWGNDTLYADGKVVRKVGGNQYIDDDGNYYTSAYSEY